MKNSARFLIPILLVLLSAFATPAGAQRQESSETRTARAMEGLRGSPPRLYAFLREMPKGADLHSHLSGAVYAESYLRWAVEDGLCISRRALVLIRPPCTFTADTVAADSAFASQTLYDQLVDAFSMRGWNSALAQTGHDRF
ncbi:MAG TPA: hypothetical protein VFS20_20760, partial [Longimicrobium sp.]|nr:hypothetical protein [Longimicrobium sp.]